MGVRGIGGIIDRIFKNGPEERPSLGDVSFFFLGLRLVDFG